ncbi:MAG: dCMP deaminase [Streptosporangiaceae bacterium]
MDDRRWLELACQLATLCPPSDTAFSVGAVLVGPDGSELSRGFSREDDPTVHAEESALEKLHHETSLTGSTMYSSLEPCAKRSSRLVPCSTLIIQTQIPRVVFAWREPDLFADCDGVELLKAAGIEVVELPGFEAMAKKPNRHLLK